jgi:hypothetical protein
MTLNRRRGNNDLESQGILDLARDHGSAGDHADRDRADLRELRHSDRGISVGQGRRYERRYTRGFTKSHHFNCIGGRLLSQNKINPFSIDYGTPVAEKPDF